MFPLFFGMPQFYQSAAGLDPAWSGLLMLPYGLGTLAAMPLAGWLNDRFPARPIVLVGTGLATASFLVLLRTGTDLGMAGYALISLGIGLGLGSIGSPTVSSLYRALAPEKAPAGSTILFVALQIGGASGVALLAVLLNGGEWTAEVGTAPFIAPTLGLVLIAALATRLAR